MLEEKPTIARKNSVMSIQSNPLENGGASSGVNLKIENLNDAVLINNEELSTLLAQLKTTESNEERLKILDTNKTAFLFTSEGLSKLLDITTSLKTKIAIIQAIGPRLTDPRAKTEYFLSLFRFTEEKETVEEVLKARTHTMSAAMFNKGDQLKVVMTAGRGGGGRGGAGRGPGVAGRGRGAGVTGGRGPTSESSVAKPIETVTAATIETQMETAPSITADVNVPAVVLTTSVTTTARTSDVVAPIVTPHVNSDPPPSYMSIVSPTSQSHPAVPMSPPPYAKAIACATPETPMQPIVSNGIDDVFDMLDRLPINPDAPLVMSAAKELRRQSTDPTMTPIREDDDASARGDTLVSEVLRSTQKQTPLRRALESPISSECLVPETNLTPRSDSGTTTIGDFSPYSPDASMTAHAERRVEVTPSPAVREETVFETESLKMIVETNKATHQTSIRLESRADMTNAHHYHEATPGEQSRSRMNSMDQSSATPGGGLSMMFSPSSTLGAAATTPRTYDRAAMMSRIQVAGTASSTESDYSSPIISPAPPDRTGLVLNVDVNRVLFDGGAASDALRSPVKTLNLGSFNGSPRRYDKKQMGSESVDSNGSDGVSASSQLDSRTHRTESLEGYFDKPRVYAISPDVSAQKAPISSPLAVTSSPKLTGSVVKKPVSYVSSSGPPSYTASTSGTPNNDSKWRSRIPAVIAEDGTTSPSTIPTNMASASINRAPFATPSKDSAGATSFDQNEEAAAVSVDFAALRNAFAKNEGGNSGSKQFSRRMSTGASASFYISTISTTTSANIHSSRTTSNDSINLLASPTPKLESASPMLHKALSTNNMPRTVHMRRHTDFGVTTKAAVLLQNDCQKVAVAVAGGASLGSDVASKCAAALKMDKASFLSLSLEEGWESDQVDGAVAMFYTYKELVRRNFTKEYVDLAKSELEKYLSEAEFTTVFGKNKEQFFAQPRWKQMDQKKKAMLF